MFHLATVLDVTAVTLTLVYYAISLVRQHRQVRMLLANERAYILVCEFAGVLFFAGGLIGTLLITYPSWNGALVNIGLNLTELTEQMQIRFTFETLRYTRWYIYGLGAWFLFVGLCTAWLAPREVFDNVRSVLRYYVGVRRSFTSATYVGTAEQDSRLTEPADPDGWSDRVTQIAEMVRDLDGAFRPSWQGTNVRLELTASQDSGHRATRHYYRFGAHAYLVVEVPGGHTAASLREFRALVRSIRMLVSVHGR